MTVRIVPCEPLEPRRLLSVDLSVPEAHLDQPIRAGGSATVTLSIRNTGTQAVTQPFHVEFKLVQSSNFGPRNSDFYDPNARLLAKVLVTNDVAYGVVGIGFSSMLAFPADMGPGRYSVVGAVDSTLAVAETNESNNYVTLGPTRIVPPDKQMVFEGTDQADVFDLVEYSSSGNLSSYSLWINGWSESFFADQVSGFDLRCLGGGDSLRVLGNVPGLRVDGGDGNDKIVGGEGNDSLSGGAGKDQIEGGGGNDRLNGNGGNDKLIGGAGSDRIYGYAGNDYIDGESSADRLDGGAGVDTLVGRSGNDHFFAFDGEPDQLFGGSGNDSAHRDPDDVLSSIDA